MVMVRKMDTFYGSVSSLPNAPAGALSQRNLGKNDLGGVIFGCTDSTMHECLSKQIFGLPYQHFVYVKNIEPGLPLFLFNYSDRKLHGIFEAASHGQMNIDPYCWSSDGFERTQYPAQVQIRVRMRCQPLLEDQFKTIIVDNYYTHKHLWFELDHAQTSKLTSLLASFAIAPSVPKSIAKRKSILQTLASEEKKGDGDNSKHFPSVSEKLDHLSVRWNSTDLSPSLGADDQLCEGHTVVMEDGQDEKELILMKLKELALNHDSRNPSSLEGSSNTDILLSEQDRSLEGSSNADVLPSEQDCFVEAPAVLGEKKEQDSLSSSDSRLIIDQLIQELAELKDFRVEQTQKMIDLEQKLVTAENEIHCLTDRCNNLESILNSRLDTAALEVVESPNEHLDLRESILLVGGYNGLSWSSALDSYFPSENLVKSLRPMSLIRSYAAVAKFEGDLYVFGGGDGISWHDTVESYSLAQNKWTLQPSLSVKKGSLAGAVSHDKIFAIGGGNGQECFSDVEMLDLDIGIWIKTRSMLQKRFALAVVELNGAIYATGGYDGNNYLNTAERFDPREHSWTRIASMNLKRGCHALVLLNEKLYALGGFDGNSMVPTVEIFDPRLGYWMDGEPMNFSRGYAAAAVLDETIYVIGGLQADESIVDVVECYKEAQSWHKLSTRAVGKRCFLSAIVM